MFVSLFRGITQHQVELPGPRSINRYLDSLRSRGHRIGEVSTTRIGDGRCKVLVTSDPALGRGWVALISAVAS